MTEANHARTSVSIFSILKIAGVVVGLLFLYQIRDILLILIIAAIIAAALNPAVAWLQQHRIPRGLATVITFIVFLGVVVFIINIVVPPFLRQLQTFLSATPQYLEELVERRGTFQQFLQRYELEISFREALSNLGELFRGGSLFRAGATFFQGFFSFVTTIVIAFYMVIEGKRFRSFIHYLIPPKYSSRIMQLFDRIEQTMGRWLWSQLILMTIVGTLTYIGLRLLSIPNAGALALLAGIFEVIPFLGPILSAIPAVILALILSPTLAIAVALLYVVVQQLENHVLMPKIMQRTIGINPIAVIIGILIGFRLGGIGGAIVAVPLIAIGSVILRDIFERRLPPNATSPIEQEHAGGSGGL